jgi:acetyl-CoA carboxylase biotin carboxyl carrier protein
MNLDIISRLVQILRDSPELGAIELRRGWFGAWTTVRVSRAGHAGAPGEHVIVTERGPGPAGTPAHPPSGGPAGAPPLPGSGEAGGGRAPAGAAAAPLVEIRSPMVGTYYSAPEAGAEPYVKVGSRVAPGQMVCIIEAMKIMNEIESEVQGVIKDVCVENAQPVEFGQTLFRVDPHG